MDSDQLELQDIGLFQKGEFTAAKQLFEKLVETSGPTESGMHSFNKTCCVAAEGEIATALADLLDMYETLPSHKDQSSLYNIGLCLLNLNRPDLTLAILAKIDREFGSDHQDDENLSVGTVDKTDHLAHLLIICIQKLNDLMLISRTQCKLIERLLIKYRVNILKYIDESVWQTNLTHILFLMDTRFESCANSLECLLPSDNLSLIEYTNATVLSNLCISYILTGRNRDAEDLLEEIGHDEKKNKSRQEPTSPLMSSPTGPTTTSNCVLVQVNLAIGTLYCVKNNYDFGLTRIFKSLDPLGERLTCQVWTQVKRCILSALDKHCKQMIHIQDNLFDKIIAFLIECETHCSPLLVANEHKPIGQGRNSIVYEARHLRSILLTIVHD